MVMHTADSLYDALLRSAGEVDKQIEALKKDIALQLPLHTQVTEEMIYRARDRNGSFILVDLLAAKAQLLSGMAVLKAADMQKGKR